MTTLSLLVAVICFSIYFQECASLSSNIPDDIQAFPEALSHFDVVQKYLLPNKRKSIDDCPIRFYKNGVSQVHDAVGGRNSFLGEFAHMAAIGWSQKSGKIEWDCGGSLISLTFVMTAAHCTINGNDTPPDKVRLGDVNLESRDDDEHAQQFNVLEVFRHPRHKFASKYFDIGLIKLHKEAKLSEFVCPACLWNRDEFLFPKMDAIGFGRTSFAGEKSAILQKVTLSPIDLKECQEYYPKNKKLADGLTRDQFCAFDPAQDTCQGDSGGPIGVDLFASGSWSPFIVGLTSFGQGCASGSPGVYTKVSSYLNFFKSVTGKWFDPVDCWYRYHEYRSKGFSKDVNHMPERHHWVSIDWDDKFSPLQDCGGVIVEYKYILTSAQCVDDNGKRPPFITFNENRVRVENVVIHPDYEAGYAEYDLALIRVGEHLNKYKEGRPACLFKAPALFDNFEIAAKGAIYDRFNNKTQGGYAISTKETDCDRSLNKTTLNEVARDAVCLRRNNINEPGTTFVIPDACNLFRGGSVERILFHGTFKYPYVTGIITNMKDCGFGITITTFIEKHYDWIQDILLNDKGNPVVAKPFEFSIFEVFKGDVCRLPDDQGAGICTLDDDCLPLLVANIRNNEKINYCTNIRWQQVVCCPPKYMNKANEDDSMNDEIDSCETLYKNMTYKEADNIAVLAWNPKKSEPKSEDFCIGSVIAKQYILTSATCTFLNPDFVHFPRQNLTLGIAEVIKHKDYEYSTKKHDLALVKLSEPLSKETGIVPICLWTNSTHTPLINDYKSTPSKKEPQWINAQHSIVTHNDACNYLVDYPLIDEQMCSERYSHQPYEKLVSVSGNQLQKLDLNESGDEEAIRIPYLIGVSSYDDYKSVILARVASYVNWIKENVK